ncbi:MAG TPA: hypothetical protein VGD58_14665 [Herpetosiphonaceae bacterium]
MVFRPHLRSLGRKPTRPLVSALILGLALSVAALSQPAQAQSGTIPDLGDAPASANNFGVAMQWHPASPFAARYPTVFFANNPSTGPKHWNSPVLYYLGNANLGGTITCEPQSDMPPDCDGGVSNIDPPANLADRDKGDDGPDWTSLGPITGCTPKTFKYFVTVLPGAPSVGYINSWYDFNQNGRWGDVFTCGSLTIDEWIVKNQAIGTGAPGVYGFLTPSFNAAPNTSNHPRWARITLSETSLPIASSYARLGSGQINGWKLGETEDYRLPY